MLSFTALRALILRRAGFRTTNEECLPVAGADGSQEADAAAAQQGLLGTQECAEVAKHCNERKLAAKMVQVGDPPSLTLHFCAALSRKERVPSIRQ